jgi:hypothetical protein
MSDYIYLYFLGNFKEPATWDSKFSYFLGLLLRQIMKTPPRLLSNMDVPGAAMSTLTNPEEMNHTKIFIFILGGEDNVPIYGNHVGQFINSLSAGQELHILTVRRPQKYVTEIPAMLLAYPGYNFYDIDPSTQTIEEHYPDGNDNSDQLFWERLTDVAYDLKYLLIRRNKPDMLADRNHTVFLAEVSADQYRNRERLKRELLASGYHVLPLSSLPLSIREFEDTVCTCLEKSILSVHIMGELYGDTPEGLDYSFQEIQNRLFTEVAKKLEGQDVFPKPARMVWISPLFDPYDDKQAHYMKRLRKELGVSKHSELVQSNLFELKNIIDQKITRLNLPLENSHANERKNILIVSDDYEDIAFNAIREEFLRTSVDFTLFKTLSALQDIEVTMNELKKYPNVVILNTRDDYSWLTSMLNLLARSKGYQEAVTHSIVGLFTPWQIKHTPGFMALTIQPYLYNSKNISHLLRSYITKIRNNDWTDSG